jgi:hypothetical protein
MEERMNGWIKLHRKLKETSFYNKPLVLSLFIHLLLSANHKDKKFLWNGKEITIKKGSLITGLFSLSKNTGISIQSIRTALTNLKSTSTITIKSTNKFSIISICNWEQYQGELTSTSTNKQQADFKDFNKKSKKSTSKLTSKKPQEKECKSTSKLTNNQQTTNKQLTTNKNDKNDKNDKNILTFGSQNNVKLTQDEYDKLKIEQPYLIDEALEFLSMYIADKGYKTKSPTHNLAIRRWVIKAVKEKQQIKTKSNVANFKQRKYSDKCIESMYEDL